MMSTSSSSVLPQETVEDIIDCVPYDTLKACTQVCRNWLPRSRSRLFHNFTFPPPRFRPSSRLSEDEYARVLHSLICDIQNSKIWDIVHDLTLAFSTSQEARTRIFYERNFCSELAFTALRTIFIQGCWGYHKNITEFICTISERNHDLQSLTLDRVTFGSAMEFFQTFYRISNASPNLQSLSLGDIKLDVSCAVSVAILEAFPAARNPPHLKILRPGCLSTGVTSTAVDVLFESFHLFQMSNLHTLLFTECNELQTHGRIVEKWGPSVTCLKLDVLGFPGNDLQFRMHLNHFRSLRILKLYRWDICDWDGTHTRAIIDSFVPNLQHLEELCIQVETELDWTNTRLPLSAEECKDILPRTIDDAKLSRLPDTSNVHLKRVDIYVPRNFCADFDLARECFPLMCQRGLLKVYSLDPKDRMVWSRV